MAHSQATTWRARVQAVVEALEKANIQADKLMYGWDSEVPRLQKTILDALTEAQRMARGAKGMVEREQQQQRILSDQVFQADERTRNPTD